MSTTHHEPGEGAAIREGDPHAELRARIFRLVYPTTPLTEETVEGLLQETFAADDPNLSAELVMTVLGRDALTWAREFAAKAAAHFPESERLQKIVRLIAPPRVKPSPPLERIDRRPDYAWLKAHATEYRGEWLVLGHGRLWGHSPSLREAEAQAREAGLEQRFLIYWVPDQNLFYFGG